MYLSDIEIALGILVGIFGFLGIGAVIDGIESWFYRHDGKGGGE